MYNNPGYIYILKILSKENKRQPGTNKNIPMLIQFEIKEIQHMYMAFIPSVSLRPCVPGLHFVFPKMHRHVKTEHFIGSSVDTEFEITVYRNVCSIDVT